LVPCFVEGEYAAFLVSIDIAPSYYIHCQQFFFVFKRSVDTSNDHEPLVSRYEYEYTIEIPVSDNGSVYLASFNPITFSLLIVHL
jgi:hypothetical protein